jgi:hypothetical protein
VGGKTRAPIQSDFQLLRWTKLAIVTAQPSKFGYGKRVITKNSKWSVSATVSKLLEPNYEVAKRAKPFLPNCHLECGGQFRS